MFSSIQLSIQFLFLSYSIVVFIQHLNPLSVKFFGLVMDWLVDWMTWSLLFDWLIDVWHSHPWWLGLRTCFDYWKIAGYIPFQPYDGCSNSFLQNSIFFPPADLKRQLEKSKQQQKAEFNSFKRTSANFRQICKELLGWNVRVDTNKVVFRMTDGNESDTIVFERENEAKPWELRPTDFTAFHAAFVSEFLSSHNSPPGFFAKLVLQALSDRTLICPM